MTISTIALSSMSRHGMPWRRREDVRAARRHGLHDERTCYSKRVIAFIVVAVLLAAIACPAFAQATGGQGDITTFLQNLVNLITGTTGKLIAVLAFCIVGVCAMMGLMSMRSAGGVVLGLLILFSASWIVNQIVGQ